MRAEDDDHRHRHRHQGGELPAVVDMLHRDGGDRRREHQQHEDHEERELRRQDRHAGDAEGVDHEHQGDLLRTRAVRIEQPRRRAPERTGEQHPGLPGAQPRQQALLGGRLAPGVAQRQRQPARARPPAKTTPQPYSSGRGTAPANIRTIRIAPTMWPASEVAIEGEGAADLVAQQREGVERRLDDGRRPAGGGRRPGRSAQAEGRAGHGAMPPWPGIWLTASTAWVREFTPRARSTAAT